MQGENGAQEMVVSAAVGGPVAPEPTFQFLPSHSWYMHCHPLVSGGHGSWASLNLLICPLGLPWGAIARLVPSAWWLCTGPGVRKKKHSP